MSDIIPNDIQLREALLEKDTQKGGMQPGTSVDELMENVRVDALTGISTRLVLEEKMKIIQEKNLTASILFIDLDNFKRVNDKYGHPAGDGVLKESANRISRHISHKKGDLVARWGGEEIVVILKGLTDSTILKQRAEELRKAVNTNPFKIPGVKEPIKQTVSIGATVRRENEKSDSWLNRADTLLYQAKATGRDRVVMAES